MVLFSSSARRIPLTGTSRRSLALLSASVLLGLVHHTDHVLRGDHSGWPFTPQVTPFTFSLLVYAFFGLAYRYRARPGVGAALVTAVLALTQFSHLVFELPHDQYQTWAAGFNLLHVHASALGVAAVALSVALSLALFTTALSLAQDMRRVRAKVRP